MVQDDAKVQVWAAGKVMEPLRDGSDLVPPKIKSVKRGDEQQIIAHTNLSFMKHHSLAERYVQELKKALVFVIGGTCYDKLKNLTVIQ